MSSALRVIPCSSSHLLHTHYIPCSKLNRESCLALVAHALLQNFSIGFGPKLLSFKSGRGVRIGGKDDDDSTSSTAASMPIDEHVEYALRLIPVGGFVSFPVNFEEDEEGVITEDDHPDLLQVKSH
jgi:membrane-associated protease RseP (regulator of RpoE activity)